MQNSGNFGQVLPSINLENMDYTDHQMILTSPRSIQVCRQNGVDIKDLYFYNFYEFREMHPELTSLNLEIQKSHYFHDQGVREVLVSKLIRQRRELINKENEYRLKQKEEKKKIEQEKRIKQKDENPEKFLKEKAANDVAVTKNKQKKQLFNILEANLREAYIKRENELKSQLEENKKNDLLFEEKIRKREQEKHKKFMEQQRQIKEKMMIEEQNNLKEEYEKKEQIRKQKEKERMAYYDMKKKQNEKEREEKAKRFKENMEFLEHKKMRLQEERQFKEKEKEYYKNFMDRNKKQRMADEINQRRERHEMIMQNVNKQNNIKIKENEQRFMDKQDKIKSNLHQKELQKESYFLKKKEKEEDYNKIHQNNIDWNNYKKEKNDKLIMEKQSKAEEFKKRNDLEKKLYQEELQRIQMEKEEQMKEQRAYLLNMKLNDDLNRINEKQEEYEKFLKNLESGEIDGNLKELRDSMTSKDKFNNAIEKLKNKITEEAKKNLNEIIKEKEKEIEKIYFYIKLLLKGKFPVLQIYLQLTWLLL